MQSSTRAERFREHLRMGAARPFAWGVLDCSLWACDWIAAERGVDPAARLRGAYHDQASCYRLLEREGGLPALAARLASDAGMAVTHSPVPGDVGVITTRLGPVLVLCCDPNRWALKNRHGVLFAKAAPTTSWAV